MRFKRFFTWVWRASADEDWSGLFEFEGVSAFRGCFEGRIHWKLSSIFGVPRGVLFKPDATKVLVVIDHLQAVPSVQVVGHLWDNDFAWFFSRFNVSWGQFMFELDYVGVTKAVQQVICVERCFNVSFGHCLRCLEVPCVN